MLEVVTLGDLALPIEAAESENVVALPNVQTAACADWRYAMSDCEGDVLFWGIWREINGVGHMLMTGYSSFQEAFIYGGHRLVTPAERRALDAND